MTLQHYLAVPLALTFVLMAGCVAFELAPEQTRQRARIATEPPPTGETAFHVLAVYQGLPPPGSRGECLEITEPECQQALLHQVEHRVNVRISDTRHPLILGLSAHERTHWRLNLEPGVTVDRVILSGTYPQRVSGLPAEARLDRFVEHEAGCPQDPCPATGPGFFDYRAPAQSYERLVPMPPTSFEGHYEEGWFEIEGNRAGVYPR